jgi:transcriptional regulator with XRE-family HTH domain
MANTTSAVVGANIRQAMGARGVTQMALADHLQKSQAAVSARVRGLTPVDVDELASIAKYLDVSIASLYAGVETERVGA